MAGQWAKRLAAACGPVLAALMLAVAARGPVPEIATLAILLCFAGGLVWIAWSSPRTEDLWAVTGPAIAFVACVAGLVFTWPWPMSPAVAVVLWFGPVVSLFACAAWAVSPGQGWPGGVPAWLERIPLRVALACAGAGVAALAAGLGGLQETSWAVAALLAVWAALAAGATVVPLSGDIVHGRASDLKLARLRLLLERREGLEWLSDTDLTDVALLASRAHHLPTGFSVVDPDLEAKAEGLGRDLHTAHDRIAEQNRVIAELKQTLADQAARVDRLSAGYRRVREAAHDNLSLLARMRGEVEGALNDVGIISDSVGQIVGTSESTDHLIDESRQRLREALESMEYVRLSIEDSLDLVEAFAKRSRQIENVLKDISDIAYFTRILSLNATIEAARAGEQGKGFRFLADEVQKLAQTITQSTSDITALLKLVQQESKQTVESVLRSANQVGEAADTVSLLDEALRRIMEELHSMDADLQDAHLMSLRVAETREGTIAALSTLEEGNRRADFAASVVEDIAAEEKAESQALPTGSGLPDSMPLQVGQLRTGPLPARGPTAPLPDMEWPEELD